MLISWEAVAKVGGVWSGMPGFLGGCCEGIGVRGACGDAEGLDTEGVGCAQGWGP